MRDRAARLRTVVPATGLAHTTV
jgi:hypothetical protein